MANRKYELTAAEAQLAFRQVSDHCHALKNWIASAVERGETERAKGLVHELREYEALFAKLNVEAHEYIDSLPK